MFAPPRTIKTEVFLRLPDEFRRKGKLSEEHLAAGRGSLATDSLLEGPSFDRAGNLYFVDVMFGRIFCADPAGKVRVVAEYDGEPNGLKIRSDGEIIVVDHRHGIMSLDPATGRMKSLVRRVRTDGFRGLNDLFFANNGDLYFTDQGQSGLQDPTGRVFRLRSDKSIDCLLNNVPSPNGLVMPPHQDALYIAVTRANSIWRASILPDGSLGRVGNFIQLSGGSGPDGLAVDQAGNLFVAHPGLGVVWGFSAAGEPILRIESGVGKKPTNLAFGGPENRHLYITEAESGSVLVVELEVPGVPMYSHRG